MKFTEFVNVVDFVNHIKLNQSSNDYCFYDDDDYCTNDGFVSLALDYIQSIEDDNDVDYWQNVDMKSFADELCEYIGEVDSNYTEDN